MDLFEFDDAREFLMHLVQTVALELAPRSKRGLLLRGQWDANWQLVPRSRRARAFDGYGLSGMHITRQEEEVFRRFVRAADAHGLGVHAVGELLELDPPSWEATDQHLSWVGTNLESMVCLAQHHGLPTPLLDWSREPLVAAYFAASGAVTDSQRNGSLAVWLIDQAKLEWAAGISSEGRGTSRSGTHWGEDFPWLRIVRVPRFSNSNLHAQAGLATLMLPPHEEQGLDVLIRSKYDALDGHPYGHEERPRRDGLLRKLTLPRLRASQLLHELELLGVSRASVFPGYASIDLLLKERALTK